MSSCAGCGQFILLLIFATLSFCPGEEDAGKGKAAVESDRTSHQLVSPEEGYRPPGFTGGKQIRLDTQNEFLPLPDRWRISMPAWERYPGARGEYPFTRGSLWNPYNQNVLKGDYAVIDNDKFFVVNLISDTIFEAREVPTPRGVSFRNPPREDFFGDAQQYFINENVVVSLELFKGAAAFRPRDWEFRVTPVFNINYLHLEENNGVDIDVREGNTRTDFHVAFQELFFEKHLSDLTPNYDFWAFRGGIQAFTSDFRGFIFLENQPGARFFGNMFSNRLNWNLAYFHLLEKDTNSGLNEIFSSRDQDVVIANLFVQDFIWKGYTAQLSYHFNYDHGDDVHFDENGFLRRPSPVGDREPNQIRSHYLGVSGEGHIGRLNLSHACYFVLGQESHNPIAQRELDIRAFMAAFEPSIDFDWLRVKGTFFYASGDADPFDGDGYGFDTIVDNPNFAGAGASYWQRQAIPFGDTFVFLNGRNSFLPSLRSSKTEGQANFVNPGLLMLGGGLDARITQKWRADFNANYMRFDQTEVLELLLFQREVDSSLGVDYSLGVQYRPLLTDNIIVNFGFALFQPLDGFADIYEKRHSLYSAFVGLTLVY